MSEPLCSSCKECYPLSVKEALRENERYCNVYDRYCLATDKQCRVGIEYINPKGCEEGAKAERERMLKSLQKHIDDADSREGCDFGTTSIAKLVCWMSAWGYDCD